MISNVRNCQPCTVCCDGWLKIDIDGATIAPDKPCQHSTDTGCSSYEKRPFDPCQVFSCGWKVPNSPLPEWMKPNLANVIVIFDKLKWQGAPVDLAVPVGKNIPTRSLEWIKRFSETHHRPLIYTENDLLESQNNSSQKSFAYGPTNFLSDITLWRNEGRNLW